MRTRRVLRACWVGVSLLVMVPHGDARADVVGPAPEDCPSGSFGDSCHAGQFCRPSTCENDGACESGETCQEVKVCVGGIQCGGLTGGEDPAPGRRPVSRSSSASARRIRPAGATRGAAAARPGARRGTRAAARAAIRRAAEIPATASGAAAPAARPTVVPGSRASRCSRSRSCCGVVVARHAERGDRPGPRAARRGASRPG